MKHNPASLCEACVGGMLQSKLSFSWDGVCPYALFVAPC